MLRLIHTAFTFASTEALSAEARAAIVQVCCTAHHEEDFPHRVTYIPAGGLHVLAYWRPCNGTCDGHVSVAVVAMIGPPDPVEPAADRETSEAVSAQTRRLARD